MLILSSETQIYTHQSVDLDNASAVSLAMLIFGIPIDNVHFMDASWDNPDKLEDILIIDMFCGIKGEQKPGPNNTTIVLSAFASILEKYGSADHQKAFEDVAVFIDAQDSTGDWRKAYPQIKFSGGSRRMPTILTVFFALKNHYGVSLFKATADKDLLLDWFKIIRGIQQSHDAYQLSKKEADTAEWYEDYPILIMRNQKYPQTSKALFNRGAEVIIYTRDYNIGAVRSNKSDVNLGDGLKEFLPDWFHHPAGFLSCWGSWKAPKAKDSGVDTLMLAEWVSRLL